MNNNSSNPIGIFDSGLGGLTVAKAVTELLPNENIIYFGDTAHLPWGDKSVAAIQAYSIKICDMLLQQNCKLILIACNTASTAAFELVKEYVGSKAMVMDVINPMIDFVREHYAHKKLGLIGTKQTVGSNVYKKKIHELNKGIELSSLATPLLVPLIEEGFADNPLTGSVIREYLVHSDLQHINALILGCTHYPLIKKHMQEYYQNKVTVIDSCEITARALKAWLEHHNLLNHTPPVKKQFYVSDYTPAFNELTKLFFGAEVALELYKLWE